MEMIAERLRIPEDLARRGSIVTVTGSDGVLVENYRRIEEYNSCRVCILTWQGRLTITGCGLHIPYYRSDELLIRGHVGEIRCMEPTEG